MDPVRTSSVSSSVSTEFSSGTNHNHQPSVTSPPTRRNNGKNNLNIESQKNFFLLLKFQ